MPNMQTHLPGYGRLRPDESDFTCPQSPGASDYTEANLGWVAKTSITVMALVGTALLAFLVYKVANTGRPDQKENPPHEIAQREKQRSEITGFNLQPRNIPLE
ncbi:MAG: hypothetical protein KAV00_05320 [Phycisphaerae bacterium]|nr:hypothetical protein [Phycisphaerae bacterium]